MLLNFKDCEVKLKSYVRALFVNNVVNSKHLCRCGDGSVLIEGAEVFVLASHHIRIHNAKNCDFYLRVRSRPKIEIRIASYCLRYQGKEEDHAGANLGEETENWELGECE